MKAAPETPLAVLALVMTGAGELMTMVLACCALGAVPLAAWMVKANELAVVGVPLNTPLVALRVRPAGSVPAAMLQVIGVVPVAMKVWLSAIPTLPLAGAALVMVLFWVAFGNVPLAACAVKLNEPAIVGVPLITPVVLLSVRPVGSVPLAMLQVIGVVPLAVRVWL